MRIPIILRIPIVVAITLGLSGTASAAPHRSRSRLQAADIVLSNFAFTPQILHLHQGHAYLLRLANRSTGSHNFSAPAFFSAARIDPSDLRLVANGSVEIGPGQSRTLRLVPAAGSYAVSCTHFLHASFGMTGRIVVD